MLQRVLSAKIWPRENAEGILPQSHHNSSLLLYHRQRCRSGHSQLLHSEICVADDISRGQCSYIFDVPTRRLQNQSLTSNYAEQYVDPGQFHRASERFVIFTVDLYSISTYYYICLDKFCSRNCLQFMQVSCSSQCWLPTAIWQLRSRPRWYLLYSALRSRVRKRTRLQTRIRIRRKLLKVRRSKRLIDFPSYSARRSCCISAIKPISSEKI